MTDPESTLDRPFWMTSQSYWQPAHFPVSAWLTHAPFAAWLTAAIRPREIVELGTHLGFSCFVFAEAAARLQLDARINAIDSWQGDDHAGFYGDEVYESVLAVVAQDYPSVRMLRGWFSDARPLFEDGSVDLLHIDGRHGYEDVTEDYQQWRSTVREGGIVLFHDIAEHDRGFGVWRLWEELEATEQTFAFHHGHGLGVLAVGEPPATLRALFDADPATAERLRRDFERLGAVVARSAEPGSVRDELERASAELDDRAAVVTTLQNAVAARDLEIASRDEHIADLDARIRDLRASTSWRVTAPMRSISRALRRR